MVTFKKNEELRKGAGAVPADRILVETDSPYLSPVPLRGRRCEPAYVVHTARTIAALRGIELSDLCALTTANAARRLCIELES
jgi:TatD DNase family protein